MRALTLTQPWAGVVAAGIKLVENRPRKMIKREDFGRQFAIHASREIDDDVFDRIAEIAPELVTIARNLYGGMDRFCFGDWFRLSQITSAVIAVATLDDMVFDTTGQLANDIAGQLGDQRRWFFGPIGYVLRDVIALPTPVPCRGWQGFWTLDAETERQVMEQIG